MISYNLAVLPTLLGMELPPKGADVVNNDSYTVTSRRKSTPSGTPTEADLRTRLQTHLELPMPYTSSALHRSRHGSDNLASNDEEDEEDEPDLSDSAEAPLLTSNLIRTPGATNRMGDLHDVKSGNHGRDGAKAHAIEHAEDHSLALRHAGAVWETRDTYGSPGEQ